MHEKTKIFRVKKGEKCLKPLPHHTFTPPGINSVADEDCLIIIPHCSEQTGVIISDEYLRELGYYFREKDSEHIPYSISTCEMCGEKLGNTLAVFADHVFCSEECKERWKS